MQIERENDIAIQKRGFHENYRFESSVCKVMEIPILIKKTWPNIERIRKKLPTVLSAKRTVLIFLGVFFGSFILSLFF